mmetsp:Transcript_8298/g.10872  ORF Transcript_8298/g.10872 Transcript_8298/m.10872 type:complete len:427 (-) Transcript_8298:15-1295(-)
MASMLTAKMAKEIGGKMAQDMGQKMKESVSNAAEKTKQKIQEHAAKRKEVLDEEEEIPLTVEQVLEQAFQDTSLLVVKQKFEPLEALTNAAASLLGVSMFLGGFLEMTNQYQTVLEGDTNNDSSNKNAAMFKTVETSELNGWTGRWLCRPHHALQLHVYDQRNSSNKKKRGQKQKGNQQEEIMYMNRGCKWTWCFSCCECCRQDMTVHAGKPSHNAMLNYKYNKFSSDDHMVAYIQEPFLGGVFSPTLQIMDRSVEETITDDNYNAAAGDTKTSTSNNNNSRPIKTSTVTMKPSVRVQSNAVCCIGGLLCDHSFQIINTADNSIIGTLTKKKPDDQMQTALQLISDGADVYTLQMPPDLKAETKAALLSAVHLIDFWMFEGEADCSAADLAKGSVAVKCCNLYCCGCVMPCGCRRHSSICWCPMLW